MLGPIVLFLATASARPPDAMLDGELASGMVPFQQPGRPPQVAWIDADPGDGLAVVKSWLPPAAAAAELLRDDSGARYVRLVTVDGELFVVRIPAGDDIVRELVRVSDARALGELASAGPLVDVGDVDCDGDHEIAVGDVIYAIEAGSLVPYEVMSPSNSDGRMTALGDLDGDGCDDLVRPRNDVLPGGSPDVTGALELWTGGVDGLTLSWSWAEEPWHLYYPDGLAPFEATPAQLDGDPEPELVVTMLDAYAGGGGSWLLDDLTAIGGPTAMVHTETTFAELFDMYKFPFLQSLGDRDADGTDELLTYRMTGPAAEGLPAHAWQWGPLFPAHADGTGGLSLRADGPWWTLETGESGQLPEPAFVGAVTADFDGDGLRDVIAEWAWSWHDESVDATVNSGRVGIWYARNDTWAGAGDPGPDPGLDTAVDAGDTTPRAQPPRGCGCTVRAGQGLASWIGLWFALGCIVARSRARGVEA